MIKPLPLLNWCVRGLVLVLYVCILLSLYHSSVYSTHCRDGFLNVDQNKNTVESDSVSKDETIQDKNHKGKTTMSASSNKRPRMIQIIETTSADDAVDGKNVMLRDEDFSKAARWMVMDTSYLTKHVIPKHDELMKNVTLFSKDKHKITENDKCPAIDSTMQLMNKDNVAIYTCMEKGLLNVLPQMNQPVTQDTASKN